MDDQQKLLKKINRRTRFTQFLAWLALFFTAVGIAAGYKNWLRIHDKAKANVKGLEEIRQTLPDYAKQSSVAKLEKNLNENFKDNKNHLDKAMHELRSIQDSTQHIAETVYTQVESLTKQQAVVKSRTPTIEDWSLGEVHFLLQTAVQRFNLNQDKKGAIEALKLADILLIERGSLELLPVRKQISEDIAQIKQYATPDTGILSEKIDHLLSELKPVAEKVEVESKAIELLPTNNDLTNETSEDGPGKNAKKPKDSIVTRVKKTINNAVLIRKHDKPIQIEMDLDAKERLYQLISLRLETLRMMMLQGDDSNYHRQIERLKVLIGNYYSDPENTIYQKQLDELAQANLAPAVPEISASLKLLEKIMSDSSIIKKLNQREG